jgi:rubredoxin
LHGGIVTRSRGCGPLFGGNQGGPRRGVEPGAPRELPDPRRVHNLGV